MFASILFYVKTQQFVSLLLLWFPRTFPETVLNICWCDITRWQTHIKGKLLKNTLWEIKVTFRRGKYWEWNESNFSSFWNGNALWFAECLWRNRVIKNQVSPCSHHWYGVHNLKWNSFLPLAISSPFSLRSKWRAGFCVKRSCGFHGAHTHLLTVECHLFWL